MKTLLLLVGPPGSGKSTFAKSLSLNTIYINQDIQGKEGHLEAFKTALEEGKDVAVDRMNFNKEQRNRYLKPAKEKGYNTKIVVLHVPSDECLQRCIERKDHPTIKDQETASKAINTFFTKYERVTDDEANVVERIYGEGDYLGKPKAVVCDIDNTLADNSHRAMTTDEKGKKNWKKFFSEMSEDKVNKWCKEILLAMRPTADIVICTARPEEYKEITKKWLEKHHVFYDKLLIRRRNDYRQDAIVKELIYEFEIKPRWNVLMWIDDRKQVIDKIREHGVTVLDCAGPKGEF